MDVVGVENRGVLETGLGEGKRGERRMVDRSGIQLDRKNGF